MKIVEDVWGMLKNKRKPNLVISVIGGAKNFNLHGKKREAIKEAILAAAKPTNAWLVTDGINIGCSKLIGEIHFLGASWGRLGALLGPSWGLPGLQNGAKMT